MIQEVSGDILLSKAHAIAHGIAPNDDFHSGLALALRMLGMSQWIMWELSALFENIGTVHDGINSISLPPVVDDVPGAPPLQHAAGDKIGRAHV